MRYHSSNGYAACFPLGPAPVVCVSRFFQRTVFVLSVAIFAALGLGFAMGEYAALLAEAATMESLNVSLLMSHLACADESDPYV